MIVKILTANDLRDFAVILNIHCVFQHAWHWSMTVTLPSDKRSEVIQKPLWDTVTSGLDFLGRGLYRTHQSGELLVCDNRRLVRGHCEPL
jgi:hypothetical protein